MKTMGEPEGNQRNTIGKPQENLRETIGKPWEKPQESIREKLENQRQAAEKSLENCKKTMGKPKEGTTRNKLKKVGKPQKDLRKTMEKSEEIRPTAWGGWEGPTRPCDFILYIYKKYKNFPYLLSSRLVVLFRYLFFRFLCLRQVFSLSLLRQWLTALLGMSDM